MFEKNVKFNIIISFKLSIKLFNLSTTKTVYDWLVINTFLLTQKIKKNNGKIKTLGFGFKMNYLINCMEQNKKKP